MCEAYDQNNREKSPSRLIVDTCITLLLGSASSLLYIQSNSNLKYLEQDIWEWFKYKLNGKIYLLIDEWLS